MKDSMGSQLHNGDLVIYCPQNSYAVHMAIVVDSSNGKILSGRVNSSGGISINSRTGVADGRRLFVVARRHETDDYENINDDFLDKLEEMNIKI